MRGFIIGLVVGVTIPLAWPYAKANWWPAIQAKLPAWMGGHG